MSSQRYPEEFRIEAAKQILNHGHCLYKWVRQQQIPAAQRAQQVNQSEELRRLKAKLKRVTEERDILKKRRRTLLVSPTEVRLYCQVSEGLQRFADVSHAATAFQWLLRLEGQARKPARG